MVKRIARLILAGLLTVAVALAAMLGLRTIGGQEKEERETAIATPVRTKRVDGQVHIVLAPEERVASGIVTSPLSTITYQERIPAFATVMAPAPLIDQQRSYQAASADAARSEINARAATLEVQRLQPLHRDSRIVSDKALESARNAQASEQAGSKVARAQVASQQASLRQQWGPGIAGWIVDGAPQLERIFRGDDLLIQLALPVGRNAVDPALAQIEVAPGVETSARIVGPVPQADARFQGAGFYAVAPANTSIRPGMTLAAHIPVGAAKTGVVVPDAAIIRWQGKPWVYRAAADGEFVRQLVVADADTPDGWLVTSGLVAGTEVAVRGAPLLLAEEIKGSAGADK